MHPGIGCREGFESPRLTVPRMNLAVERANWIKAVSIVAQREFELGRSGVLVVDRSLKANGDAAHGFHHAQVHNHSHVGLPGPADRASVLPQMRVAMGVARSDHFTVGQLLAVIGLRDGRIVRCRLEFDGPVQRQILAFRDSTPVSPGVLGMDCPVLGRLDWQGVHTHPMLATTGRNPAINHLFPRIWNGGDSGSHDLGDGGLR